ncbi:unnamed protein product [Amoebophrya sp. A25]|nr:unnamed protein product [Amoebophrya sp. A25]|eukprot:GSA25T00019794001.1
MPSRSRSFLRSLHRAPKYATEEEVMTGPLGLNFVSRATTSFFLNGAELTWKLQTGVYRRWDPSSTSCTSRSVQQGEDNSCTSVDVDVDPDEHESSFSAETRDGRLLQNSLKELDLQRGGRRPSIGVDKEIRKIRKLSKTLKQRSKNRSTKPGAGGADLNQVKTVKLPQKAKFRIRTALSGSGKLMKDVTRDLLDSLASVALPASGEDEGSYAGRDAWSSNMHTTSTVGEASLTLLDEEHDVPTCYSTFGAIKSLSSEMEIKKSSSTENLCSGTTTSTASGNGTLLTVAEYTKNFTRKTSSSRTFIDDCHVDESDSCLTYQDKKNEEMIVQLQREQRNAANKIRADEEVYRKTAEFFFWRPLATRGHLLERMKLMVMQDEDKDEGAKDDSSDHMFGDGSTPEISSSCGQQSSLGGFSSSGEDENKIDVRHQTTSAAEMKQKEMKAAAPGNLNLEVDSNNDLQQSTTTACSSSPAITPSARKQHLHIKHQEEQLCGELFGTSDFERENENPDDLELSHRLAAVKRGIVDPLFHSSLSSFCSGIPASDMRLLHHFSHREEVKQRNHVAGALNHNNMGNMASSDSSTSNSCRVAPGSSPQMDVLSLAELCETRRGTKKSAQTTRTTPLVSSAHNPQQDRRSPTLEEWKHLRQHEGENDVDNYSELLLQQVDRRGSTTTSTPTSHDLPHLQPIKWRAYVMPWSWSLSGNMLCKSWVPDEMALILVPLEQKPDSQYAYEQQHEEQMVLIFRREVEAPEGQGESSGLSVGAGRQIHEATITSGRVQSSHSGTSTAPAQSSIPKNMNGWFTGKTSRTSFEDHHNNYIQQETSATGTRTSFLAGSRGGYGSTSTCRDPLADSSESLVAQANRVRETGAPAPPAQQLSVAQYFSFKRQMIVADLRVEALNWKQAVLAKKHAKILRDMHLRRQSIRDMRICRQSLRMGTAAVSEDLGGSSGSTTARTSQPVEDQEGEEKENEGTGAGRTSTLTAGTSGDAGATPESVKEKIIGEGEEGSPDPMEGGDWSMEMQLMSARPSAFFTPPCMSGMGSKGKQEESAGAVEKERRLRRQTITSSTTDLHLLQHKRSSSSLSARRPPRRKTSTTTASTPSTRTLFTGEMSDNIFGSSEDYENLQSSSGHAGVRSRDQHFYLLPGVDEEYDESAELTASIAEQMAQLKESERRRDLLSKKLLDCKFASSLKKHEAEDLRAEYVEKLEKEQAAREAQRRAEIEQERLAQETELRRQWDRLFLVAAVFAVFFFLAVMLTWMCVCARACRGAKDEDGDENHIGRRPRSSTSSTSESSTSDGEQSSEFDLAQMSSEELQRLTNATYEALQAKRGVPATPTEVDVDVEGTPFLGKSEQVDVDGNNLGAVVGTRNEEEEIGAQQGSSSSTMVLTDE